MDCNIGLMMHELKLHNYMQIQNIYGDVKSRESIDVTHPQHKWPFEAPVATTIKVQKQGALPHRDLREGG